MDNINSKADSQNC